MNEYAFDVRLQCALRVRAGSIGEALLLLRDTIACSTANLGAWPDGSPIIAEVSVDYFSPHLYEINGRSIE